MTGDKWKGKQKKPETGLAHVKNAIAEKIERIGGHTKCTKLHAGTHTDSRLKRLGALMTRLNVMHYHTLPNHNPFLYRFLGPYPHPKRPRVPKRLALIRQRDAPQEQKTQR